MSYLDENGNMTFGYALAACPAQWEKTGRYTFIVNHAGRVLQCNLGPETSTLFTGMTEFNPDPGWSTSD